jgi:hypothetical protein
VHTLTLVHVMQIGEVKWLTALRPTCKLYSPPMHEDYAEQSHLCFLCLTAVHVLAGVRA